MFNVHYSTLAKKRALQGVVAAFGAPVGWLLIEAISGVPPNRSITSQPGLYSYMLFGTMTVFSIFGFYVGSKESSSWSLALHDSLTGAFNRLYFDARITEEFARQQRTGQVFTLACIDIDHFKKINDSYGHAAGDAVLKELVNILNQQFRATDVVARIGGEEFSILLPNTNAKQAIELLERLLKQIRSHTFAVKTDMKLQLTVSIGLTLSSIHSEVDAVLEAADEALYKAKHQGRDQLVFLFSLEDN